MEGFIRKKRLGPATKRQLTQELVQEKKVPVSRACKLLSLTRSQFYYRSKKDDKDVIEALQELAFKHPSYGFRKLFAYLRRSGKSWNHKRVYRVYKLLKLNRKRRGKRRLPARVKQPLTQQSLINQSWSMDFMSDSMVGNRKFRTLNVMDDCSREVLAIEIDTSLSSKRVIRTLERIIEANDNDQADNLAENIGIYFDGVELGYDCECCGDRWSSSWGDEYNVPSIYGQPVSEYKTCVAWMEPGREICIHYLDGRKEWLGVDKE